MFLYKSAATSRAGMRGMELGHTASSHAVLPFSFALLQAHCIIYIIFVSSYAVQTSQKSVLQYYSKICHAEWREAQHELVLVLALDIQRLGSYSSPHALILAACLAVPLGVSLAKFATLPAIARAESHAAPAVTRSQGNT
jgi:hypothetical protein